ncbi:nitroreductase family protein [Cohnella thailandensis]|uniref:Nitroreductase family protein n=1 Tax=Cohnella thailandensis TaxID=557557 RepID=A0A841ST99_9BACL|nr:nitroreductase family protein [Cohnella thailandensis]MBB6633816.1 nitroreductase family protein [Cohnella thailandensis]MBP1972499.1 nitroreductase [Cohnella thailandensis]
MTTSNKVLDFNEVIHGRRTIKKYDPEVKISREEMSQILKEATLAPSSFNLQPWRFVIIESQEAKEKLIEIAPFNSTQIFTSSAVIAVFGDLRFADRADEIYGKAVELGHMPQEMKDKILATVVPIFDRFSVQEKRESMMVDGGLVSMQLLLSAYAHGYATNPMAGFNKEKMAEAFGLDAARYIPILIISIGKAAAEGRPPVRLPVDDIAQWK